MAWNIYAKIPQQEFAMPVKCKEHKRYMLHFECTQKCAAVKTECGINANADKPYGANKGNSCVTRTMKK